MPLFTKKPVTIEARQFTNLNNDALLAKTHIAFIHETARESWARDLGTGAMIVVLWSVGAYADSAALEWCGVVMGLFLIVVKAMVKLKGLIDNRMTPDQARKWLDEKFPT